MVKRINVDLAHFKGAMPERNAIAWYGYLAALIEWGLLEVHEYDTARALLPVVDDNPIVPILLGRHPGMIHLESSSCAPVGMSLLTDDLARAHWILSNDKGWKVALSQNIKDSPPQILATTQAIFVGLYHGALASISPNDGRFIAKVTLPHGNGVFWTEVPGFVIAEGEMAVGVFRPSGEFIWQKPVADVIATVEVVEDSLKVTDASGRVSRFDLQTGNTVG
jgi:hypothetical protein